MEMSKFSAHWRDRVKISKELLSMLKAEKMFLNRIITGDEYGFIMNQSKSQSKQMKRRDEPVHIKVKAAHSAGESMTKVFWESKGILLLNWVPEKATINSGYHIEELKELSQAITRERRGKLSRGVLLQHDNARPHVSSKTVAVIRDFGFECLHHPLYCLDLAPSDYRLFGEMKRHFERRFRDFKGLDCQIKKWGKGTPKEFYVIEIEKLPEPWKR